MELTHPPLPSQAILESGTELFRGQTNWTINSVQGCKILNVLKYNNATVRSQVMTITMTTTVAMKMTMSIYLYTFTIFLYFFILFLFCIFSIINKSIIFIVIITIISVNKLINVDYFCCQLLIEALKCLTGLYSICMYI